MLANNHASANANGRTNSVLVVTAGVAASSSSLMSNGNRTGNGTVLITNGIVSGKSDLNGGQKDGI